MIIKSLGERIKAFRKQAGLTQEKLSSLSGLALRYVQDVESGNKQASITTVFKIASALELTPGQLLDEIFQTWQSQGMPEE